MAPSGLSDALATTLACFDDEGTPLTTTEVAETLDLGRRSTYDRLDRLVDADRLATKKVGANARVWWQPSEGTTTDASRHIESETLDRYESVFETIGDAIYVLDEALQLVMVNEATVELTGRSRSELIGTPIADIVGDETVDRALDRDASIASGDREFAEVEFTLERGDESIPVETRFTRLERDDGTIERVGSARDIRSRTERERQLRRYEKLVETIDDGVYTVDPDGTFTMVNGAYAEMTGYSKDDLIGEDVSAVVTADTAATASNYQEELLAGNRDTVRFQATLHTADGDRFPAEATFAILPQDDAFERVGVVRDVSERVARERELERQRQRLAALNALNNVFREVTDTVIDQSTRAEIEATVCETLTTTDSYSFAWIGGVAVDDETVSIRTDAGVDNPTQEFPLVDGGDGHRSSTVVETAVADQAVAVTTTVAEESNHDPWLAPIDDSGVSSAAAIPIYSEHSLVGLLTVYSERSDAFDEAEQGVLQQLGGVVGHAITAADRKQALTSDNVVELEFEVQEVFDAVEPTPPAGATIDIEQSIQLGENSFIEYCTATESAMPAVEAMVASSAMPNWVSYSVLDREDEETRFELRLEDSSFLESVADYGGYVQDATIEGSDLFMRLQFSPTTNIRRVVDTLQETTPGLELITQRHVTRESSGGFGTTSTLLEALTDRQRTVLQAAYHRGYFSWPREADGTNVAESLEIAPATFNQHLRRAQQQLFTQLLESSSPSE